MHLLTLNAVGKQLAPPQVLPRSRRRLSQVIGRHVDRTRPHMIAIQNARDPLQPIAEAWVTRGWKVPPVKDQAGRTITEGVVKPWPRRYLAHDDIVVVVYMPRGGMTGSSGGSRSKSPLSIALSIAAVALIAFSGPIGGAIAGLAGVTSAFGVSAITFGVVVAGSALMGLASKAKANTAPVDNTKVYGVSGGGNLPRPGDRVPKGYGRSWMKPDLSQPDFNQYEGNDLCLTKRHTVGLGRYRIYALRAGKQSVWTEANGWIAPFNEPRNRFEILYGTASAIAPSNVVSASGVGGELPRLEDNPQYAGPYLINQRGALVTRLQIDYQFPSGISRIDFLKTTTRANQPGEWGVQFEYATIDDGGNLTSPWMILYSGNSGNEKPLFSTHPLRYTKFKDVPPGRYAVRGVNVAKDTSAQTTGNAHQNTAQWDGASGWVNDVAIRPGITEIVARIYSTEATGSAAFGELEVDASAIIPVWNGSQWVDQETSKCVWAFCDIMRNQTYGGGLPDSQVDRAVPAYYANLLTEFDTFDGVIRGPVSVYEAASTVLLPMRAEPVHLGRYWSIVRDDIKTVRKHVITRRQMLKGSTRITFDLDTHSGAGHVIGEYDRDGDYRNPGQTTAIFGEASLTPLRQKWTGVKTYEHATHLTRWRAAIGAYRRQSVPFGVAMEGRIYKRGDAIRVDPWFVDGRATAGVTEYNRPSIFLDYRVDVKPGDVALFRDRAGREWGPVSILRAGIDTEIVLDPTSLAQAESSMGGSLASIMDDGVGEMTVVTIGQLSVISENYLIQSVTMNGSRKAQVQAVIDDPRVWDAIGTSISQPPVGETGLADPVAPAIVGLTANATQIAAGLRCDYSIRPGRGAVRFEFGVSYDAGVRFDSLDPAPITGSIILNPVSPQTVTLRARAFGASGLPGAYYYAPLTLPSAALGVVLPPIDYADFSADVKARVDYVLQVQAHLEEVSAKAQADFATSLAAAGTALASAQAAGAVAQDGLAKATDGLAKAIQSLSNDQANQAAIVSESSTRLTADQAATTRIDGAISRIGASEAAIISEASTRATADTASTTRLDGALSRIGTAESAIVTESSTRASADSAAATVVSGVSARLDTNIAALATEVTARTTANTAIVTSVTNLTARVGTAEASVTSEASARVTGDSVQAQRTDAVIVKANSDRAYFLSEQTVRINTDGSLSSRIDAVVATAGSNTAAILSEQTARANADSASATRIDGVSASTDYNLAAIIYEQNVRASQDTAITNYVNSVNARVGNAESSITTEQTARATADSALTTSLFNLSARVGTTEANYTNEVNARVYQDNAIISYLDNINIYTQNVQASVTNESNARFAADTVYSSQISDVYARTLAGTASGQFSLQAVSGPGGVSARVQALLATQYGGQTYGAGYYLDLMSDGSSRFVVDANAFYITANGSSTPLLSFDGYTLRVPNLQLTGSNVPQGTVNAPARFDAANYTLIAGQGQVNNVYDPNMITNVYSDTNNYPTIVSLYGTMTLGPNTLVGPLDLIFENGLVVPLVFGGVGRIAATQGPSQAFVFSATGVVFLGAGNHQARFRYTYTGSGPSSSVVVNEIHLAAVTPRA